MSGCTDWPAASRRVPLVSEGARSRCYAPAGSRRPLAMPSLLIRCHVADYPAWKAVFDEHEPSRRANGSQGGWLFRDADDPQEVLLLLVWDDLERARLFADSDDLRET